MQGHIKHNSQRGVVEIVSLVLIGLTLLGSYVGTQYLSQKKLSTGSRASFSCYDMGMKTSCVGCSNGCNTTTSGGITCYTCKPAQPTNTPAPECLGSTKVCDGNRTKQCESGQWKYKSTCSSTQECKSGECVAKAATTAPQQTCSSIGMLTSDAYCNYGSTTTTINSGSTKCYKCKSAPSPSVATSTPQSTPSSGSCNSAGSNCCYDNYGQRYCMSGLTCNNGKCETNTSPSTSCTGAAYPSAGCTIAIYKSSATNKYYMNKSSCESNNNSYSSPTAVCAAVNANKTPTPTVAPGASCPAGSALACTCNAGCTSRYVPSVQATCYTCKTTTPAPSSGAAPSTAPAPGGGGWYCAGETANQDVVNTFTGYFGATEAEAKWKAEKLKNSPDWKDCTTKNDGTSAPGQPGTTGACFSLSASVNSAGFATVTFINGGSANGDVQLFRNGSHVAGWNKWGGGNFEYSPPHTGDALKCGETVSFEGWTSNCIPMQQSASVTRNCTGNEPTPTPSTGRDCSPSDSCVNRRWCGNDGKYHDEDNAARGCTGAAPAQPTQGSAQTPAAQASNVTPQPTPTPTPAAVNLPTTQTQESGPNSEACKTAQDAAKYSTQDEETQSIIKVAIDLYCGTGQ